MSIESPSNSAPANTQMKTPTSKRVDAGLALELAVGDFWPSVPKDWSQFCLYRELHEDFRTRADIVGPDELRLDATKSETWHFLQHTDDSSDQTTFLVLSQYTGDPYQRPVSARTSLARLSRISVVGGGTEGANKIKAALPMLPLLTHIEFENAQSGQEFYREILSDAQYKRLHDGSLYCIVRGGFLDDDASQWLRCLPSPAAVASHTGEEEMTVAARVSIARRLIMGRMFPCEMESAEASDPLFAAGLSADAPNHA
eukprot:2518841-Rhodomonas_salina.3